MPCDRVPIRGDRDRQTPRDGRGGHRSRRCPRARGRGLGGTPTTPRAPASGAGDRACLWSERPPWDFVRAGTSSCLAPGPGPLAGAGTRPCPGLGLDMSGGDHVRGAVGDPRLSQRAPPPRLRPHLPTPPSPGVQAADLQPRNRHEFSAQATSSTGRAPGTLLPAPARRPSSCTVPKATCDWGPEAAAVLSCPERGPGSSVSLSPWS